MVPNAHTSVSTTFIIMLDEVINIFFIIEGMHFLYCHGFIAILCRGVVSSSFDCCRDHHVSPGRKNGPTQRHGIRCKTS